MILGCIPFLKKKINRVYLKDPPRFQFQAVEKRKALNKTKHNISFFYCYYWQFKYERKVFEGTFNLIGESFLITLYTFLPNSAVYPSVIEPAAGIIILSSEILRQGLYFF